MDPRQQRGLIIAATQKLIQKGKIWLVPSQTGNGKKYTVCPDPESPFCSCPDHDETGRKCKHLYAVEFVIKRDVAPDGTVTETRTYTFTEQKVYRQQTGRFTICARLKRSGVSPSSCMIFAVDCPTCHKSAAVVTAPMREQWGVLIGFGARDAVACTSRDVSLFNDRQQANGRMILEIVPIQYCPFCGESIEIVREKR